MELTARELAQERHKELRICVTARCNLFCKGCHGEGITKGGKPIKESLRPDDYAFVFRAAKKLGITGVCLSGGEPTIWPHIVETSRKLKEEGAEINMITNGVHSLRVKEVFDSLQEVHLSLHSADEQEEKLRKVYKKKKFDKLTLQTLSYLAQKDLVVKLNVIATAFNSSDNQIMTFVRLAREFGAIPRYIELYPKTLPDFKSKGDLQIQLEDIGWEKIGSELRKTKMFSTEFGPIELLRCGCAIAHALPASDVVCQSVNQVYLFPDGSFNYCRQNNEKSVEASDAIKNRDESGLLTALSNAIRLIGSPCKR